MQFKLVVPGLALALAGSLGVAADVELEAAGQDLAELLVRVGVPGHGRTGFEPEQGDR